MTVYTGARHDPALPRFHLAQRLRSSPGQEATVHVMAHGLHYGSSVFEGIRSYETPNGEQNFG